MKKNPVQFYLALLLVCFVHSVSGHQPAIAEKPGDFHGSFKNICCADTIPKPADTARPFARHDAVYQMNLEEAKKHRIDVKDAANNLEKERAVEGKVFGYLQKNGYVEAYMGGDYPNHLLLIRLRGKYQALADSINGKMIRVIGGIVPYRSNKPMIAVNRDGQIEFM